MTAEVEWKMTWMPTLAAMPWRSLECEDFDRPLFIKSRFEDNSYEVLVTDLHTMWSENLREFEVKKRLTSLNPNIEAPLETIMDHIQSNIEESSEGTKYNLSFHRPLVGRDEDKLLLKITSQLSGVPFIWKINGEVAPSSMFTEHIMTPVMTMVGEMLRRQAELIKIIHNKDKEIEDYKNQGVSVSRRHIETDSFDESEFNISMNMSKAFEDQVKRGVGSAFDTSSKQLYKDIMVKNAWINKPETSTEGEDFTPDLMDANTSDTASASVATFDDKRMPPSLLDLDFGMGSLRGRDRRSDPHDSKDIELRRREELNKRLQEEDGEREEKKKRKKKVLF